MLNIRDVKHFIQVWLVDINNVYVIWVSVFIENWNRLNRFQQLK